MSDDRPTVTIHTDGACSGNPGPGGWGVVLAYGKHRKELKGGVHSTTNNRMELMAAIKALEALKRPCSVDLHTDSQYLRLGMTKWVGNWMLNGWRTANKKPVKNADLWRKLIDLAKDHQIRWHWLEGHVGHVHNERADALAQEAIQELRGSSVGRAGRC